MSTGELEANAAAVGKKVARSWRRRFEQAMKPSEMLALVEELHQIAGSRVVTAPHLGFWRDAFVASRFTGFICAQWARLIAPPLERPDFEMSLDGAVRRYEVTEADRAERRRNDEYRSAAASGETCWHDRMDEPEEVVQILGRATSKKVAKAADYDAATGLVIYLNVWCVMPEAERDACFREGTRAAQGVFSEVWVLKDNPVRVW